MINKTGWLVNDCLTCIPNTKTFWHFLLEGVTGLEDKTGGYTPFNILASKVENEYKLSDIKPDYIIRNATFFDNINVHIPTISLLQDPYDVGSGIFKKQVEVCNNSSHVVYNSEYTKERYHKFIHRPSSVIKLGTNSNLCYPQGKVQKNKNTIIYVGSSNENFKGFSLIKQLIKYTEYNFILVMKDDFQMSHSRVSVYNKINQEKLVSLLNKSDLLVCTSRHETLHLAGIEAMFCNVPVVASDVGIYCEIKNDKRWGKIVDNHDLLSYIRAIEEILNNDSLSPREVMFCNKLSLSDSIENWNCLLNEVL